MINRNFQTNCVINAGFVGTLSLRGRYFLTSVGVFIEGTRGADCGEGEKNSEAQAKDM